MGIFKTAKVTFDFMVTIAIVYLNPRSLLEEIVTQSLEGGQSDLPPTFDTIHPIDLKIGT